MTFKQTSLFESDHQMLLPTELFDYKSGIFNYAESIELLKKLTDTIAWKQETILMFGRKVLTPRLTAWYGDENISYKYSGVTFYALPWTEELLAIKSKIEPLAGEIFNSVLLNLYRDGNDSMGWHSDDEPELGTNPIIASVNFGQEMRFDLRLKRDHKVKHQIILGNGSVLTMKGDIQHHWQHQVAKSAKSMTPRINLTFRRIIS